MLTLHFEGWLECRLATDPDPTDEPRGVSGWTFAVAGEPDLDRTLRLQPDGAVNRRYGPPVGVAVRRVSLFGQDVPGHPLLGAPLELLDGPVFEGRNGIAAEDAEEPIVPFHPRIRQGGITLRREHRDPRTGDIIQDRPIGFSRVPTKVADALGIADPRAYRTHRAEQLSDALATATDPIERAALTKRLRDIERGVGTIAEAALRFALPYRIVLAGPWVEIRDRDSALQGVVETSEWIADFWVGAWDADALCAYMQGRFELPFRPA
jgi:hypothetical protein